MSKLFWFILTDLVIVVAAYLIIRALIKYEMDRRDTKSGDFLKDQKEGEK